MKRIVLVLAILAVPSQATLIAEIWTLDVTLENGERIVCGQVGEPVVTTDPNLVVFDGCVRGVDTLFASGFEG